MSANKRHRAPDSNMDTRKAAGMCDGAAVFGYFQDVTRERGFPPFALEVALRFGVGVDQAMDELRAVRDRVFQIMREVELPRQNRAEVVRARLPPKKLPSGSGRIDLKPFTGRNGWPALRDRMMYWQNAAEVLYVHGSVDFVLHDEQIALTPETEACLYSADGLRMPDHRKGSRPFLERVVADTTKGCESDRATVMALVRLVSNVETNPYRHRDPNWARFLGGTEEEVLRKSWRMCNETSRLLCVLCQIAGIPARGVFCFADPLTRVMSHAMTEVFFDGKWNLVEQNFGVMFLMKDGYFASVVELRDGPDIINSRADVGWQHAANALFGGAVSILPYDGDHTERYEYPWQSVSH